MTKKYKNEGVMKVLVILGAIVGLITLILGLPEVGIPNYAYVEAVFALHYIINFIIGLVIVVLTFLVGLRPNNPIPFHWLVLILFAILLVLFGAGIWSCILVLIAGIIGIIEEL